MSESTAAPPIVRDENQTDETRTYLDLLQSQRSEAGATKLRESLSERFRGTSFVMVRGFLTDVLDRAGVMMKDQITAVTALGGMALKPTFDSEQSPAVNAPKIARKVSSAGSKVVLVTHSKGSVDTLTALLTDSAMRDKVAGWISIQGAVQGSTVADDLSTNAALRPALSLIFSQVFGGSIEALDALRTHDRVNHVTANLAGIAAIAAKIPIVAYGSSAGTTPLRIATSRHFQQEPENDGLLSLGRTVIPHARTIVQHRGGPDHGAAVMGPGPERIHMTYALLSLLLKLDPRLA